jgi:hypothetical protein
MSEPFVPSVRYKQQVERDAMKELQLAWIARQLFQNPKLLLTDEAIVTMPVYLSAEEIVRGVHGRTLDGRRIFEVSATQDIQRNGLAIIAQISGNDSKILGSS